MLIKQTKKNIIAGLLVIAILPQACHKRVLVIPDACMTASKTEIKKNDTVIFTDCCKAAENVQLFFYKTGQKNITPNSPYSKFDANHRYQKVFTDTGSYTALVYAINSGVQVQTYMVLIKVNP